MADTLKQQTPFGHERKGNRPSNTCVTSYRTTLPNQTWLSYLEFQVLSGI